MARHAEAVQGLVYFVVAAAAAAAGIDYLGLHRAESPMVTECCETYLRMLKKEEKPTHWYCRTERMFAVVLAMLSYLGRLDCVRYLLGSFS